MINSGVIISILQIENVNVRCEMFDIIMAALPSDFTLPPYDLPLLHYFIENREENLSMQWINKHHDVMEQLYANERPLEGALRQQLFNLAWFMVDRGVDVDFIDENEDTVLHRWLKEGGYARPPERIVTKFANSKNILGATPLVYTILYENSKMFQFLVDKTDLTLTSNEGMTPLHFAAIKCDQFAIDILLRKMNSKSINQKNKFGNSALMEASLACESEILFAKILELFVSNNTTIPAIENLHGKRLEHLLAIRNFGSVLCYLIRSNQVDITQIDKEGLKPIHNALLHGSIDALKILVDKETDFRFCSEKYGTLFHMCKNADVKTEIEMVKVLIDEVISRNEDLQKILDIPNSGGVYAVNRLGSQSFQMLQNALLKQKLDTKS